MPTAADGPTEPETLRDKLSRGLGALGLIPEVT